MSFSRLCPPVVFLISVMPLSGCIFDRISDLQGKINIHKETEPDSGDVYVPPDPNSIPDQTTRPDGSGGLVPGDGNGTGSGGKTGSGSINTETLAITSVSQSSGDVNGGYEIRIYGELLDPSGSVRFGSLESPLQTYVNSHVVRAVVPPSRPGCIDVFWIQGGEELTLKDGFCYVESIGIDQVYPQTAIQNQPTPVEITGSGMDENTVIYFSDSTHQLPIISPEIVDSSHIRGYLPPLDPGDISIVATNSISRAVSSNAITIVSELLVDSVAPQVIPVSSSRTVQIQGTGFDRNTKIRVGSQQARILSVSSKSLSFTAPQLDEGDYDILVYDNIRQIRLENAIHYFVDDAQPHIFAVVPDYASTQGGESVKILGANLPDSGSVSLGNRTATVTSRSENAWDLSVPQSQPGIVDVSLGDLSLPQSFEYIQIPKPTSISPYHGVVKDGFKATISGSDFTEGIRVFFGPFESPDVQVNSSTQLTVEVPPGAGTLPLRFVKDKVDFTSSLKFMYDEKVEILGITPSESVVTGRTSIQLYGRGFSDDLDLVVDDAFVDYKLLSRNTLSFVAPAHDEGIAEVYLTCFNVDRLASIDLNYYVASGIISGGAGGNIDGELHVTVLTTGSSEPIPKATVYIGSDIHSAITGTTDEQGRVSFFGPQFRDAQVVIACAPEHSCNTLQPINARYVTLLLEDWHAEDDENNSEEDPEDPPDPDEFDGNTINPIDITIPYSSSPAYFTGRVRGLDKNDLDLEPGYENVAFLKQSSLSTYDLSYNSSDVYLVKKENGIYKIKARNGEVALAAICGIYNDAEKIFIPKSMGVVRHQMVSDGKLIKNDIECNIPLNHSQNIKLLDPPLHSGPDIVIARGYIFLGNEGYLGGSFRLPDYITMESMLDGYSKSELVSVTRLPAARGVLSDMTMYYTVGAYTLIDPDSDSLEYTSPSTVFYTSDIDPNLELVEVGPTAPIPIFTTSSKEDILKTGRIAWTVEYPQNVDFYAITIRLYSKGDSRLLYQFYLPGSATTAEFPTYHDWPGDKSGSVTVQITAYKSIRSGFDFNLFSTAELRYNYIHSSASASLYIRESDVTQ